jgi:hypothetical protein
MAKVSFKHQQICKAIVDNIEFSDVSLRYTKAN